MFKRCLICLAFLSVSFASICLGDEKRGLGKPIILKYSSLLTAKKNIEIKSGDNLELQAGYYILTVYGKGMFGSNDQINLKVDGTEIEGSKVLMFSRVACSPFSFRFEIKKRPSHTITVTPGINSRIFLDKIELQKMDTNRIECLDFDFLKFLSGKRISDKQWLKIPGIKLYRKRFDYFYRRSFTELSFVRRGRGRLFLTFHVRLDSGSNLKNSVALSAAVNGTLLKKNNLTARKEAVNKLWGKNRLGDQGWAAGNNKTVRTYYFDVTDLCKAGKTAQKIRIENLKPGLSLKVKVSLVESEKNGKIIPVPIVMERTGTHTAKGEYTFKDIDVPLNVAEKTDLFTFVFMGDGLTAPRSVDFFRNAWKKRTFDVKEPGLFIAGDVKFNPPVRSFRNTNFYAYPGYVSQYGGQYVRAYLLTGDSYCKKRLKDLADFSLWSQYDKNGNNAFLDKYGYKYKRGNKAWAYGWPTWPWPRTDAYGYNWKVFEPYHHCVPPDLLIKAYEIFGDKKYLQAATKFVEHQHPRFGNHKGVFKGKKYYWTEYNPTDTGLTTDATDNVVAVLAEYLAGVGYHTKNKEVLENARGLLWYCCKEFDRDGTWYYDGEENPLDKKRKVVDGAHEYMVLFSGLRALAYLEAAGLQVDDMKKYFRRGAVLLLGYYPTERFSRPARCYKLFSLAKAGAGRKIKFTTFIKICRNDLYRIDFMDTIGHGFESPRILSLEIKGPRGSSYMKVSVDKLKKGCTIITNPAAGEIYEVSYHLAAPDKITGFTNTPSSIILEGEETKRRCLADFVLPFSNKLKINADNFKQVPRILHGPQRKKRKTSAVCNDKRPCPRITRKNTKKHEKD